MMKIKLILYSYVCFYTNKLHSKVMKVGLNAILEDRPILVEVYDIVLKTLTKVSGYCYKEVAKDQENNT